MPTLADTIKYTTQTHWKGTAWENPADTMAWHLYNFFSAEEERPCWTAIEDIKEADIERFKGWKLRDGVKASTINKYLSVLSVLFDKAIEMSLEENKKLPIHKHRCPMKPTIKRLKEARVEKWWLPPSEYASLELWFEEVRHDKGYYWVDEFQDYLRVLVYQGLRPREALALRSDHVDLVGLTIKVPGTKTTGAEASIPIFNEAQRALERRVKRGTSGRLFTFDYSQARSYWQICREHLGATNIPGATLKSLRRTFANIATKRGMPTAVLQKVLRHSGIDTTEGYLRLTGGGLVEESRKYMDATPKHTQGPWEQSLMQAMSAYTKTGATPEEVAAFTLALLKG